MQRPTNHQASQSQVGQRPQGGQGEELNQTGEWWSHQYWQGPQFIAAVPNPALCSAAQNGHLHGARWLKAKLENRAMNDFQMNLKSE